MLDMLLNRRSCREFEDRAVEADKIDKILRAAQLSPTGKGTRAWEFVVIEDKETLKKLGSCRDPEQPFLPKTPLAIAVTAAPAVSDTWIEDCSIAGIVMQLEAEKLGLGSCWVQIRMRESNQGVSSEEYVRGVLGIPEDISVECIIGFGYPVNRRPAHTMDEVNPAKIHSERY
ncbi:MAG: nitroreductase family protein [Candidatus Heteroscillospira sp.]|jgi:nitroreductase